MVPSLHGEHQRRGILKVRGMDVCTVVQEDATNLQIVRAAFVLGPSPNQNNNKDNDNNDQ